MKDNLNLMKVGWNDWWWVYEMRWLLTRPAIQFIDFFSILLFENEKIEEINRIDGLWAAASGLSINEIDWMERCKCWLPSLDSLPAAVMGGGTANGSAKGKTNKKSNQQRNQIMSELIVGWLELNLVEWNENKTADQSHQSMNGAPSASAVSGIGFIHSFLLPLRERKEGWKQWKGCLLCLMSWLWASGPSAQLNFISELQSSPPFRHLCLFFNCPGEDRQPYIHSFSLK